jgi:hypothetical protein
MRRLSLLTLTLLTLMAVAPATAGDIDPDAVPRIGTTAPALGLYAFEKSKGDEPKEPVQLDERCGLRPGSTTGVLLFFVDGNSMDDLEQANEWWRLFHRQGLEIMAVSVEPNPFQFKDDVIKANFKFPVLDDRQGVVARRYGVDSAPFSFLLNEGCQVLGFSNNKLTEDAVSLAAAIEAQVTGQISSGTPRFDD